VALTKAGKPRMLLPLCIGAVGVAVVFASATGCSWWRSEPRGEIVGIHANAAFEDLGSFKNLAYGGKLAVLLPDGKKVEAKCPEQLIADVKGCPNSNAKEIHAGLVTNITIVLIEKQQVLLSRKANEWDVVKVLK